MNTQRVRAVRELLNQRGEFARWWHQKLCDAIGTPQQDAWLRIGAECEAAAGITAEFDRLDFADGTAELLLNTGLVPPSGSRLEADLLDAVLQGNCPQVTSIRSMPAQVAAALSPGDFFTSSNTGFVVRDDRTRRRRSEAITQLARAGSPYAAIARKRAFKVGQKGSTFPWVNTAAALHGHAGRCWLASEITIIGASSPFSLAYIKKSTATAFGSRSHPSELLAQSRSNRSDAEWWRRQLTACDDDLARSEWALALWGTASGDVVSELLSLLERVLQELPAQRRSTVLRAADQLAGSGWLKNRPVTGNATNSDLGDLIELRASAPPTARERTGIPGPFDQSATHPSLLSVARSGRWLKVDSQPAYR